MDREFLIEEAVYDSDYNEVKRILQDPPEDIQLQFPKVLLAAARLSDLMMVEVLLDFDKKSLQKNPHLFHWDRYSLILDKCLEKSNTGLLKVLCEHIKDHIDEFHSKYVEEYFVQSILMGCSSDFLNVVDSLYQKLFQTPEKEKNKLFNLYEKVLKVTDINDKNILQVLYYVVTIGIKRHVSFILHTYLSLNEPPIDIKDHLLVLTRSQRQPDIAAVLQPLAKNAGEADLRMISEFYSWNRELESLSSTVKPNVCPSQHSGDEFVLEKANLVIQTMNSSLLELETQEVQASVCEFMKDLSSLLDRRHQFLQYKPVLVGSACESTRCFYPDEFDFLLVFENLQTHLSITKFLPNLIKCRFTHMGELEDSEIEKIKLDDCLAPDNFKRTLDETIEEVINQAKLTTFNKSGVLSLEKTGTFRQKSKYNCLFLTWKGDKYKDMKISVDLVPAFTLQKEALPHHSHMPKEPRLYASMLGEVETYLSTAFSVVENEIMVSLPQCIREGYKIAKGFRNGDIVSQALEPKHLEVVHSIEDLITSYMLKTCVFFITQNMGSNSISDQESLEWALAIYTQLKEYVIEGFVPHFFLNNTKDKNNHAIFACDPEDRGESHLCCKQREVMLIVIERIMYAISLYKKTQ